MKLARVNLARAMAVGRYHKAELTEEQDGEMQADLGSRTIRLGNQLIPFEAVNSMTQADPGETCPECAEKFNDARALGVHRRHKHGVKGERAE